MLIFAMMKFKKHISILLAFVVFMANIGYSFTVHYCNDTIASISLKSAFEEPCIEEIASCCALENNHDKCCSDKVIKVEKKTDNFIAKHFKIGFDSIVFLEKNSFELLKRQVFYTKKETVAFYCDSNAPPIYKLNCQLVLYA